MPGRDGTGPGGFGPGTGWGTGYCREKSMMGYANLNYRNWMGFGYIKSLTSRRVVLNEKRYLEQKAEFLRDQLRLLNARLSVGSDSKDGQ